MSGAVMREALVGARALMWMFFLDPSCLRQFMNPIRPILAAP